ncbi:MAG TPA: hypothetical protein VMY36_04510 [Patescibacteria group bacterium]|nr:hypothetical protein [Patescibacteria group bacterium]
MNESQELNIQIVRDLQEVIREGGLIDKTVSEEEAREFLPQLLLTGEQMGISAPELGSAMQITEAGILKIDEARIQANHPQFQGVIKISGEFYNIRGTPKGILAQRNLKVETEGTGVKAALVKSMVKIKLAEPHKTIVTTLREQARKQNHELKQFGIWIQGGEEKSLRILLEVT